MNKKAGKIVSYIDKEGKVQKAIALHHEQTAAYKIHAKVFLRVVNDDLSYKKSPEEKYIISVKHVSELTDIGFTD